MDPRVRLVQISIIALLISTCVKAQPNETVSLATGTYNFQSSQGFLSGPNWGLDAITQIAQDLGFSGEIGDGFRVKSGRLAVVNGIKYVVAIGTNTILENSNSGLFVYGIANSLGEISPGEGDADGHMQVDIAGEEMFTSGADSWEENGVASIALSIQNLNRIEVWDIAGTSPPQNRRYSRFDNLLLNPVAVAKLRNTPGVQDTYTAVLTHNGIALVVYDYEQFGGVNNGLVATYGLSEVILPEGYQDGHLHFKDACSVASQHGRIYVCDSKRAIVQEFSLDAANHRIILVHTNEMPEGTTPISISGDQQGSLYVVDGSNNDVLKFSTRMSQADYTGPMILVDRFGQNPGESIHTTSPVSVAASTDDILIFQTSESNSVVIQGVAGGKVHNIDARALSDDLATIRLRGICTGTMNNVTIHSRSVSSGIERTYEVAGPLYAGLLRQAFNEPYYEIVENRPYGEYDLWISWSSSSCHGGWGTCREPAEGSEIRILCGSLAPLSSLPNVEVCSGNSNGSNLHMCWTMLEPEGVSHYSVLWGRELTNPLHEEQRANPPFVYSEIAPLEVYDFKVAGVRNGSTGPYQWTKVAVAPNSPPASLALNSVSTDEIRLTSAVPQGANGIRVYYGEDPENLTAFRDFRAGAPLVFNNANASLQHDRVYFFQVAGVVLSSDPALYNYPAAVGPRNWTNIVSTPLAPTISGTVTWSEKWFASFIQEDVELESGLIIGPGGSLEIEAGVHVKIGTDHQISVQPGGLLKVLGDYPNHVMFSALVANERWTGLRIQSNNSNNIVRDALIQDAAVGIWVQNGYCTVEGGEIRHCGIGAVWTGGEGRLANSLIRYNDRYGAYLINSPVDLIENQITDNDWGGLRIWSGQGNQIEGCEIESNGRYAPESSYRAGLQLLQGAMTLECNKIEQNDGPGAMLFSMTFADMSENGGYNVLFNNCAGYPAVPRRLEVDYGQLTLAGGIPSLACGHNSLYDDGVPFQRKLITSLYQELPQSNWRIQHNYWGVTDTNNIHARTPSNPILTPVLLESAACPDPHIAYFCSQNPEYLLFRSAWDQEQLGQFASALTAYKTVVDSFPNGDYVKIAIDRIIFCDKMIGSSWAEVREYFLDMAEDSNKNESIVSQCKSNAAWCLAETGLFDDAFSELDSLLNHASSDYEWQYLSLKSLLVELQENEYEFLAMIADGSLPRASLDGLNLSHEREFERVLSQVDSVVSLIGSHAVNLALPKSYVLYQNYPNPFNPSTEIRFDLPEAVRVELKVFNILGQEVVTLVDDVRAAGAYRILWDGKNAGGLSVASGVYVYQLKTGNFQDAKKMVLIR